MTTTLPESLKNNSQQLPFIHPHSTLISDLLLDVFHHNAIRLPSGRHNAAHCTDLQSLCRTSFSFPSEYCLWLEILGEVNSAPCSYLKSGFHLSACFTRMVLRRIISLGGAVSVFYSYSLYSRRKCILLECKSWKKNAFVFAFFFFWVDVDKLNRLPNFLNQIY